MAIRCVPAAEPFTVKTKEGDLHVSLKTLGQTASSQVLGIFRKYMKEEGGKLVVTLGLDDYPTLVRDMIDVAVLGLDAVEGLVDAGGDPVEYPKGEADRYQFLDRNFKPGWTQQVALEVFTRSTVSEEDAGNSSSPHGS